MHDDDNLSDLPEALPLRCVSPFWRIFAVGEGLILLGLLFVVLMLGFALLRQGTRVTTAVPTAPPRVMMAPPMTATVAEDEPVENPVRPYPVRDELRTPSTRDDADTLRKRFFAKSQEVWRNSQGFYPSHVIASPDGLNIAYVVGENLAAGPTAGVMLIPDGRLNVGAMVITPGGRALLPPLVQSQGGDGTEPPLHLLGVPAWSSDSRHVFITWGTGGLRRYDVQAPGLEDLPFRGEAVTPVPGQPTRIVFARSRPVPKLDVAGAPPALDPTEVVLAELDTKKVRVLVPASTAYWRSLSVSPDGKRLTLVSNHGLEGKDASRVRLFVMDLEGGTPKPLAPSAARIGPVGWTPDGKALVYARSQDPLPPEALTGDPSRLNRALDLFLWDLTTNQEMRLSRGGSCYSPSVSNDGNLWFLTWEADRGGHNLRLRRLPLDVARAFAAENPDPSSQDAAAWTELVTRILETAKVSPEADAAALTPEVPARLADTFNKEYEARFKQKPPQTPEQFDRQRQSLQRLALPHPMRSRLSLLLGAVEGEYLRRQQRATWHLKGGPLRQPGNPAENDSPFGYVLNPFQLAWIHAQEKEPSADEDEGGTDPLAAALHQAAGRPLVLANDPAVGQAAVAALVDPDLARGAEMLKKDLTEAGEEILLRMLKQERHARNDALVLAVGKLLYEQGRLRTLKTLMKQRCDQQPYDARTFNLLGLSYLPSDTPGADADPKPLLAVEAFKNALRCDLHFGPAYLNLAQAYEQSGDARAARQCLRRYLQLFPDGAHAVDAQRRLAALAGS